MFSPTPSDLDLIGCLLMFKTNGYESRESVKCFFIDRNQKRWSREYGFRDYFYVEGSDFLQYIEKHALGRHVEFENTKLIDLHVMGGRENEIECFKVYYPKCVSKSQFLKNIMQKFTCFEYDVPLSKKIPIEFNMHVGCWYKFKKDFPERMDCSDPHPELKYMVFDLEVSKKPHCFPIVDEDPIMSIAMMTNHKGIIFVNSEFFGDIYENSFTYKNSKFMQYDRKFEIKECSDEGYLLKNFINELTIEQPEMWITYNGELFDFPYILKRCEILKLEFNFGFKEYKKRYTSYQRIHLDVFAWVKRDSYLPEGQRSLKKTCELKLGFKPEEVDPEQMMIEAKKNPMTMISYNISDVVSTKILSDKFVEPYMFALGKVSNLNIDDLLRKGSGGICDVSILENYHKKNIKIDSMPTRNVTHVIDDKVCKSSTYIGGYVESTTNGIHFHKHKEKMPVSTNCFEELRKNIKDILMYNLDVENIRLAHVTNLKQTILSLQTKLLDYEKFIMNNEGNKDEFAVYHFDVNAMYPNIILHYKLQPHAIRYQPCCDYCLELQWTEKLECWNMSVDEYERIRSKHWNLSETPDKNKAAINELVTKYLKQQKRSSIQHLEIPRKVWVCQQAMSAFLENVSNFKKMRYEYKDLLKKEAKTSKNRDRMQYLDNIQLAYKCVLNSFYGWLKMPGNRHGRESEITAALICECARNIIKKSDEWLDEICNRINTDTDGTYRKVPKHFPMDICLEMIDGNKISLNFINCILNYKVKQEFVNDKYIDETGNRVNKCFIIFEADGPYKMSFLPSNDKGENVKKKYVVYGFNNSIAFIKGCEIVRSGEFEFVKRFQKKFFDFLATADYATLKEFYDEIFKNVVLEFDTFFETKARGFSDEYVLNFLKIEKKPSKPMDEYSNIMPVNFAIKKMAELMNDDRLCYNKPKCGFVVLKYPEDVKQITKRVVPIVLFEREANVISEFIKKWTNKNYTNLQDFLDWKYYQQKWADCRNRLYTSPRLFQCGDVNSLNKRKRGGKQGSIKKYLKIESSLLL